MMQEKKMRLEAIRV